MLVTCGQKLVASLTAPGSSVPGSLRRWCVALTERGGGGRHPGGAEVSPLMRTSVGAGARTEGRLKWCSSGSDGRFVSTPSPCG